MKSRHSTIITDFFLHTHYRKLRYFLSVLVLSSITVSMILNNNHYLESPYFEALEWLVYFVLVFGLIAFNVFLLVPLYLLKNRIVPYFTALILTTVSGLIFIVYMKLYVFGGKHVIENIGITAISANILSLLVYMGLLLGGSASIQLFRNWIKNTNRIGELQTATSQSELELLKNQINPHFLLNMLNNANVLIWKNKEEAQQLLYKLENLLRYQLKESVKDEILLIFDIRFLQDFLNLEKIRRDKFEFSITTQGIMEDVWLPSLLFIPFVENAIKHNPDNHNLSYVYLYFCINGNKLEFRCENSKPAIRPVKKKTGGLGLQNIRRRLSLLYPGKHFLEMKDQKDRYIITLKLELK